MNLGIFNDMNLYSASADLFQQLGIKVNSNTSQPLPIEGLLKHHLKDTEIFKSINQTFFIGIIDDSVFQQMSLFKGDYSYSDALQKADKSYDGLMFFALELAKHPTRTEISELTRAFNRISQKMPVALILKYKFEKETALSITISERFKYKQNWRQGEKTGKVIILRDVKTINTHTGHQRILLDLVKPVGVNNYAQLHEHWLQVLDVSILNKQFYQKLFNWYLWALTKAEFPQIRPEEDKIKNDVHQSESLIRLLSRLLFCWFMKEKGLINPNLFNIDYLRKILKGFEGIKSEETIYYKAILQNLFFATLNKPIEERKIIDKGFNKKEYGDPLVYRYEDLFKDSKTVLSHFENIPFLNGGLFDCLDQKKGKDNPVEIRLDGFSTKKDKQPIMPDMFFFGEYDGIDLSEEYDDKRKSKVKVFGLLDILHQYKFTIEENTPLEEEIALDPELLGKVFENLLASYNPETKTTARKQTGSFYTPREIVNYMVDESLLCYLKNTIDDEERLRNLFSYNETVNPFDKKETRLLIEAINTAKILDPACGSGAFPMGMLQKLIHILYKLDPENKIWFELVIANFPSTMQNVARQRLEKENWNFVRKLGIIQECIYGVDIQPIAIQISKLRFFISLLVDQTERPKEQNRGFEPLPNLDFKLIAANTLIGAPESEEVISGLFSNQSDSFFSELDILTSEYFNVHLPKEKFVKKNEILKLINKKILDRQKSMVRAKELKIKKQTDAVESEIKLWNSYANLFKHESIGFFEIKYFFPSVKNKFDIIIGNPPYSSKQSIEMKEIAKKYNYVEYKCDPYALFLENATNLSNDKGIIAFITPLTWLTNHYYFKLRKFFIDTSILSQVLMFDDLVFESANVDTSIVILNKHHKSDSFLWQKSTSSSVYKEKFIPRSYKSIKAENRYEINTNTNEAFIKIRTSIERNTIKLSSVRKISLGMKLESNEQYVKREYSKKFNEPIIFGNEVGYYEPLIPSHYFNYNNSSIIGGTKKQSIHNHKPKIMIQAIRNLSLPRRIVATIDEKGYYFVGTVNALTPTLLGLQLNEKYLLALINSNLLNSYFKNRFTTISLTAAFLGELPIKDLTNEKQQPFITIVDYILLLKAKNQDSQFFERLVDVMVYELYLHDEIKKAGVEVLSYLSDLPKLKESMGDNLKIIENIYKKLASPTHPISAALLKLLNVEEVKIIEGIK